MKPFLIGQRKAVCPACGGIVFLSVPAGHVEYYKKGLTINIDFKAQSQVFLCASISCRFRPWTMQDLHLQDQQLQFKGDMHAAPEDGKGTGSEDRGARGEAGENGSEGIIESL